MASAGATRAPATCPCPHPGRLHPPRTSPWPRHCNAIHPRIPPQAIPPIGPSDANAATGDRAWHRCASALQEGSVTEASGQKEEEKVPMATVSQLGPSASSEWEVDFCSRPLLDERGKKVWELLVCNADRSFQHSEYFPNNKINSKEVRGRACIRRRLIAKPRVVDFRPAADCGDCGRKEERVLERTHAHTPILLLVALDRLHHGSLEACWGEGGEGGHAGLVLTSLSMSQAETLPAMF
eukprot:evm.model.scf_972.7 EVM.evm.TU.scf_972.7   scf_972:44967-45683(+)